MCVCACVSAADISIVPPVVPHWSAHQIAWGVTYSLVLIKSLGITGGPQGLLTSMKLMPLIDALTSGPGQSWLVKAMTSLKGPHQIIPTFGTQWPVLFWSKFQTVSSSKIRRQWQDGGISWYCPNVWKPDQDRNSLAGPIVIWAAHGPWVVERCWSVCSSWLVNDGAHHRHTKRHIWDTKPLKLASFFLMNFTCKVVSQQNTVTGKVHLQWVINCS